MPEMRLKAAEGIYAMHNGDDSDYKEGGGSAFACVCA